MAADFSPQDIPFNRPRKGESSWWGYFENSRSQRWVFVYTRKSGRYLLRSEKFGWGRQVTPVRLRLSELTRAIESRFPTRQADRISEALLKGKTLVPLPLDDADDLDPRNAECVTLHFGTNDLPLPTETGEAIWIDACMTTVQLAPTLMEADEIARWVRHADSLIDLQEPYAYLQRWRLRSRFTSFFPDSPPWFSSGQEPETDPADDEPP